MLNWKSAAPGVAGCHLAAGGDQSDNEVHMKDGELRRVGEKIS